MEAVRRGGPTLPLHKDDLVDECFGHTRCGGIPVEPTRHKSDASLASRSSLQSFTPGAETCLLRQNIQDILLCMCNSRDHFKPSVSGEATQSGVCPT